MNIQSLNDEQKKLEQEIRNVTVDRYHSLHEKAADRGEFSHTHAGKRLVNHVTAPFEAAIYEWIADASSGKAGRKPSALRLVSDFDDVPAMAFLFTKAVINLVPMLANKQGTASRTTVILSAVQTIHDELRLRWFNKHSGRLLKQILKDFDKRDVNRTRRRELIKRTFRQRQFEWVAEGWTRQNRVNLGVKLLELFRDSTGFVELAEIRTANKKSRAIVKATPVLIESLADRMEACENMFTVYYPMVVKPRKWSPDNLIGGGYLTNNINPYRMVKGAKVSYLNELSNVEMPKVYEAINAVQETGFRVNKNMLDVLEWAFDGNKDIDGLPSSTPRSIPEAPHNINSDEGVKKEYLKECYIVHDENRRAISKRDAVIRTIKLAKKFSVYDEIFFPHDLDSRGRLYPKPSYLTPQGTGYVKSLLEFSEGKPLNEGSDVAFVAIAGANAYGEDKISLQARVDWVFSNEEMILSCAENPKHDLRWTEADSPFEFLRFCFEWKGINEHGVGYVSHMPCAVDATCSGLQHFSAMLRDEVGGFAVNLTECAERQDIYGIVADKVEVSVKADLKVERKHGKKPKENEPDNRVSTAVLAKIALDLGLTRKLTKRSVMIVPYSGTFSACMKYTEDFYSELFAKGVPCPLDKKTFTTQFIPYIAKHIWSSIDETVVAARDTMNWMKGVSKLATAANVPLQWTTPIGFVVQQAKYKQMETKVRTYLDGKQIKLSVRDDTTELDPRKNASSLSPNYIHSMDASHLMLTVVKAKETDRDMSFMMIHDSFGVHAADMRVFLDECVSPAFYEMYEQGDNLEVFLEEMKVLFSDDAEVPTLPSKGKLDLSEVLYSDFFFS